MSAWEFFQGPFDFNKTPLGPVGCRVLIHAKTTTRLSWDFRAKQGFYIGPALDSYRCFKLVKGIAYCCDCCGRVQKFGSEIIFQAGSYPEFDYFKKFQVFDFLKSLALAKVVTK